MYKEQTKLCMLESGLHGLKMFMRWHWVQKNEYTQSLWIIARICIEQTMCLTFDELAAKLLKSITEVITITEVINSLRKLILGFVVDSYVQLSHVKNFFYKVWKSFRSWRKNLKQQRSCLQSWPIQWPHNHKMTEHC